MKKILSILLLFSIVALSSSCADVVDVTTCLSVEPVGFWYGLWHGVCAPFSFIGSLFSDSISIYATYNNGTWYDFGFVLGAGILGGSVKVRKK